MKSSRTITKRINQLENRFYYYYYRTDEAAAGLLGGLIVCLTVTHLDRASAIIKQNKCQKRREAYHFLFRLRRMQENDDGGLLG